MELQKSTVLSKLDLLMEENLFWGDRGEMCTDVKRDRERETDVSFHIYIL